MLSVSLTFDDAPSVNEPGVSFDAGRMDRMREALLAAGIESCVAFVVGASSKQHEANLERWVEAGFELGNHLYEHHRASRLSIEEFCRSLDACDEVIAPFAGYQDGKARWFRFPYLDRGRDPEHRRLLQREVTARGYRVAHASTTFRDEAYELRLQKAKERGDILALEHIGRRFRNAARGSIDSTMEATTNPGPVKLVSYGHFGEVCVGNIFTLVEGLRHHGARFCSLEEALSAPEYAAFDHDFEKSGLVTARRGGSLRRGAARRLARLSERRGWFRQADYGPLWPNIA